MHLILFIPNLCKLLKKHVHITCSNDTCQFYKLNWRKFLQPNLKENSILIAQSTATKIFLKCGEAKQIPLYLKVTQKLLNRRMTPFISDYKYNKRLILNTSLLFYYYFNLISY